MSKKYTEKFEKIHRDVTKAYVSNPILHDSHFLIWIRQLEAVYSKKKTLDNFIQAYHRNKLRDAKNAWNSSERAKEYSDLIFTLVPYETHKISVTRKVEIDCFPHYIRLKRGDKGFLLDRSFIGLLPPDMQPVVKTSIRDPVVINGDLLFLDKEEYRLVKK